MGCCDSMGSLVPACDYSCGSWLTTGFEALSSLVLRAEFLIFHRLYRPEPRSVLILLESIYRANLKLGGRLRILPLLDQRGTADYVQRPTMKGFPTCISQEISGSETPLKH